MTLPTLIGAFVSVLATLVVIFGIGCRRVLRRYLRNQDPSFSWKQVWRTTWHFGGYAGAIAFAAGGLLATKYGLVIVILPVVIAVVFLARELLAVHRYSEAL